MPRLPHGTEMTPATLDNARSAVADRIADIPLGPAIVKPVDRRRFDLLFLDLQDDPNNLLPESQQTRDALVELGEAMADQGLTTRPVIRRTSRLPTPTSGSLSTMTSRSKPARLRDHS
jgi:hypothetical protein